MNPRIGRPKVDNPKKNDLKVRFDDEALLKIDKYCKEHGLTRSEAIRMGISLLLGENNTDSGATVTK